MNDLPTNLSHARPVSELLPAIVTSTIATGSSELSTTASSAPVRLSDNDLAAALAVASATLPALAQPDERFLEKCLRMMTTLPRRKDDSVSGQLRVRAYQLAIGNYPCLALEFLVTEALRACKFFPSTAECVEILSGWQRNDDALRAKRAAETAVRRESQARFDDVMQRMADGECEQAEVDALPRGWKSIAEMRGYLRLSDGAYTLRVRA
jgi:hypothetical protein